MLACLLFAQGALAAVPCVLPDASAADAFAPAPDCHDAPPANLCLAQCVAFDQTSSPAPTDSAPPTGWVIALVPAVVALEHAGAPLAHIGRPRPFGPPPFRLLCSLLL